MSVRFVPSYNTNFRPNFRPSLLRALLHLPHHGRPPSRGSDGHAAAGGRSRAAGVAASAEGGGGAHSRPASRHRPASPASVSSAVSRARRRRRAAETAGGRRERGRGACALSRRKREAPSSRPLPRFARPNVSHALLRVARAGAARGGGRRARRPGGHPLGAVSVRSALRRRRQARRGHRRRCRRVRGRREEPGGAFLGAGEESEPGKRESLVPSFTFAG